MEKAIKLEGQDRNLDIEVKVSKIHVCYASGNCVTCRRFDPKYHGGYCDYHKVDTTPSSSCSDYWAR